MVNKFSNFSSKTPYIKLTYSRVERNVGRTLLSIGNSGSLLLLLGVISLVSALCFVNKSKNIHRVSKKLAKFF